MDVAAWLRGLGLEQYAQLFRDNDGVRLERAAPYKLTPLRRRVYTHQ
jgi:SAM (Sterile alpha motif) domain-containing protein